MAALAGLPRPVVERASDLLAFLEQQAHGAKAGESGTPSARAEGQSSLMGYFAAAALTQRNGNAQSVAQISSEEKETLAYLSKIDADELSPRQAHEELYRLKKLLGGTLDV